MATIYIDKQPYQTHEGQNLLAACLSLGFDLPYFCWHPALHSVGSCRQCAVKMFAHANDPKGRLAMACMTPVKDGMCLSINDPEAVAFRKTVVEWLMVNHPHDCPVCDEGGECHLQDMTVMTGHEYRRYRFTKRTYRNQDLGPFVNHEMNRCIQCFRCVRFYRDFAGGDDLETLGWHDHIYFGRSSDGTLRSPFSGNLVEVCPTGVFTDKTLGRHYTRKWDLQTAPSVCVHCSLGCNTIPGERYGTLRRVHNRYNAFVNGYFMCDRGRYGYESVNSACRERSVGQRHGRDLQPVEPAGAIEQIAGMASDGRRMVGIGSPRASLEANFALRALVGPERFFSGLADGEQELLTAILAILRAGPAQVPSLREIESADAVLVLGEDPTNSAPMLDLALRQSVRQKSFKLADELHVDRWNDAPIRDIMQDDHSPLFVASPAATAIDRIATACLRAAPQDIARLGQAVAGVIAGEHALPGLSSQTQALAEQIAAALRSAQRPVIVSGTGCGSLAVVRAAGAIANALCREGKACGLFYVGAECNSLGAAMIGGKPLRDALAVLEGGAADTLVVLENDLFRRAGTPFVEELLAAARNVVVLDSIQTPTAQRAGLVVPAAPWAESDGTLVSNEGRAQRFYKVYTPTEPIRESWRWLRDVMLAAGRSEAAGWETFDDVVAAMVKAMPQLAGAEQVAPPEEFRADGMRIPRQPHRYSGRTAMFADKTVFDPQPPTDADSPLAFSMEGYEGQPPSALLSRYWSPQWNSVQALNKFQQEVGSLLRHSMPGVRLIETTTAFTTESTEITEKENAIRSTEAFESRAAQGQWLIVPAWHVFGSEELSAHSPGIASLSPEPYLAMNGTDAKLLNAAAGVQVEVALSDEGCLPREGCPSGCHASAPSAEACLPRPLRLPLKIDDSLPAGVAALPTGLRGMPYIDLPAMARIIVPAQQPLGGGI